MSNEEGDVLGNEDQRGWQTPRLTKNVVVFALTLESG